MRYLSVLFILTLCSCATKNPELASEPDSSAVVAASSATMPDFYRKYTGVLAGQNITAYLTMKNGKLGGAYYYDRIGIPIVLWPGSYDGATKRYELLEGGPGQPQVWRVAVTPGRLQGTWSGKSQAFDLDLKEADGVKLVPWIRTDSVRARPDSAEPKAIVGLELLLPQTASEAFEREIIKLFPAPGFVFAEDEAGPPSRDINEFWQRMREHYFRFYKEVLAEEKPEELSSGRMNFTMGRTSDVYFDRNDFLVLSITSYEYSGGAHGNGGTEFLNYDMRTSHAWKLSEMITVDSAKIIALLDKAAHAQFDIPENVPLNPNVLLNDLYIPANYFVTHKGITFSYWPYAIASYAQGEIQLFLPWSELRDLLKPEFAQRLGAE